MTGKTVYIVDDDEDVRNLLEALLMANGFDVCPFDSGEAFLEKLHSSWVGCLVTDIRMPGMDGLTLQTEIANRKSALPVIVITGHGDIALAVRAMRAGAIDFIEKPFDKTEILNAIERALAQMMREKRDAEMKAKFWEHVDRLTPREQEVLRQLIIGGTNKEIARALNITPRTVEVHRAQVMDKMHAESLSHLVRIAIVSGIEFG